MPDRRLWVRIWRLVSFGGGNTPQSRISGPEATPGAFSPTRSRCFPYSLNGATRAFLAFSTPSEQHFQALCDVGKILFRVGTRRFRPPGRPRYSVDRGMCLPASHMNVWRNGGAP